MASKKSAPPPLQSLVEEILLHAKAAGNPITKTKIAQTIGITNWRLSSLLSMEKRGEELPVHIMPMLKIKFPNVGKDVVVKVPGVELVIGDHEERLIRLESHLSAVLTLLFAKSTAEEQAQIRAAIQQDGVRLLDGSKT